MFDNYLDTVILMILVPFLFTSLIMPIMIKISHKIGAIDVPKDNRRVHVKPTPLLGGLGIYLGFLFGYMIFGIHSVEMNSVLIASFILVLVGLVDCIQPLSAKEKIIGQLIAALIVTVYGNILLTEITAFGLVLNFGWFAYPITIFFIVSCINIINLVDGIDGLSSGISSIFYLTIGIIAFFQGRVGSLDIMMVFIMFGATTGFLVHNFPPAKIFVGEIGVSFMGFIIAIVSLLGYKGAMLTSFIVPIVLLAIPILDTAFAILRRFLKKKPLFEGDKDHFHHQFLNMNLSPKKTVLIIYFISILFSLATIFYVLNSPFEAIIIYGVLIILTIWFVLHTNIISEKVNQKVKKFEEEHLKRNNIEHKK